jgi:glutamine cyclotransferase
VRAATILKIAASALAGAAFSCPLLAQEAVPAVTCSAPAMEQVRVVARMPHDPRAFTQGLIFHSGALLETTGQYGQSQLRRLDARTGKVLLRRALPADQFGEGLGRIGNELVALTWTNGVAHRFAADTLKPLGSFRYQGEGWGLTSDGKRWIRSDGSDNLIFHDAATFKETGRVRVTLAGTPLPELNELEWIGGLVFANVWHSNVIVAIDPKTGCVARRFDLSPLSREVAAGDPEAVLNGIAWDEKGKRLYVTGKDWPRLFEIALPERQ